MTPAARFPLLPGSLVCFLLTLAGCGSSGQTGSGETVPLTNIAAMERLATHIGEEILVKCGGDIGSEVVLDVDSSESSWIVRGALTRLLLAGKRNVLLKTADVRPGRTRWSVRGIQLSVGYDNIRKPGFFAGALVDRTVSVTFRSEILNGPVVAASDRNEKQYTDTIPESRVAMVEDPSSPCSRGTLPELNTIDRYVEPFVIIGATGAAIFLFFQVRS